MRVERVDAIGDVAAARRWFRAFEPAADDHRAVAMPMMFDDWYASFNDPSWPGAAFWVRAGHDVVGMMVCHLPTIDNRHLLDLGIRVPPSHRRRGIGTALLRVAQGYASDHDRTTVLAEVVEPLDVVQGGSAGSLFASRARLRRGHGRKSSRHRPAGAGRAPAGTRESRRVEKERLPARRVRGALPSGVRRP
ncbi:MAG: GNAT family N-acetyltransferase, partial [Nocardioidaceae bacterium]|nr:GNAT family N-acetyltransferase [Nocardioidaceae bacterium]